MPPINRRQSPGVVDGRVKKKNNWQESPELPSGPHGFPAVIRERSGIGHRRLLLKRDIERFIGLLPQWDNLSVGLESIVLAEAEEGVYGWHMPGCVALCVWWTELWEESPFELFEEHRPIYCQIGVPFEPTTDGYRILFNESTARAFQPIHILIHELGHHHDRITTASRQRASRGDSYAERYAQMYRRSIWMRYMEEFGTPD